MDFSQPTPHFGTDPRNPSDKEFWPNDDLVIGATEDFSGWGMYNASVIRWCQAAYEEADLDNQEDEEVKQIQKYIDYLSGKQWSGRQPTYKARPVDNRISRLFWELVSLLTDIRPIFEFKTTGEDDPTAPEENQLYAKTAKILNQVTRSWWSWSNADQSLSHCVIYALFCIGYAKFDWDPTLRNGEGDFCLVPCGPNDLLLLKPKNTLQSAQCVIYQSAQPLGYFRDKYPLRGPLVQPSTEFSTYNKRMSTPSHMAQYIFDSLTPAMKRKMGNPGVSCQSAAPMALYREFWLRDASRNTSNMPVQMGKVGMPWGYVVQPGEKLYPRGRLIVMGGDDQHPVILDDGPNPFLHGEYPFAALRMNSVPWKFSGLSELRNWIPLQDIVNMLLAGTLNLLKKIVNPPLIAAKNAFDDGVWDSLDPSMPGLKLAWNQNAGSPPTYGPVPNLPPILLSVMQAVGRELEISSGVAAVNQALSKKQVPGGETLEKIQQSQQTPVRLKGRALEVFLRDLGKQAPSNTFQFYSKKRRILMLGKQAGTTKGDQDFTWNPGTLIPDGVTSNEFAGAFHFNIQPGTLLNIDREPRKQVILALRKNGDISRKAMYKELEMGLDVDQIEKELMQEAMQKAKLMQIVKGAAGGGGGGGQQPGAPQ